MGWLEQVLVADFPVPDVDPGDRCARCGQLPPDGARGVLECDLWGAAVIYPGQYPSEGFPLAEGSTMFDVREGDDELEPGLRLDVEADQVMLTTLCGPCSGGGQVGLPIVPLWHDPDSGQLAAA